MKMLKEIPNIKKGEKKKSQITYPDFQSHDIMISLCDARVFLNSIIVFPLKILNQVARYHWRWDIIIHIN